MKSIVKAFVRTLVRTGDLYAVYDRLQKAASFKDPIPEVVVMESIMHSLFFHYDSGPGWMNRWLVEVFQKYEQTIVDDFVLVGLCHALSRKVDLGIMSLNDFYPILIYLSFRRPSLFYKYDMFFLKNCDGFVWTNVIAMCNLAYDFNKSKKSNIMASETLARAIMFQWKLKTSKVELEVLVTVFDVFKLFLTKEFQTNPKGLLWCMDVAREENILIIYNMLTHACLHDEMISLKVRDYLWDHAVATRTLTKEMEGLAHIFLKVHPHKRDHDEEAFTGLHGSTWDVLRSLARRHTEGPGEWWQVTEYFR